MFALLCQYCTLPDCSALAHSHPTLMTSTLLTLLRSTHPSPRSSTPVRVSWIALTSKGDNPSSKWEQITVVKFHSFCGIVESNREERFEKWERVRECWNPGGHFIAAHCFHHAGVTVTETSVRKTFSVARDQYSEEEWVQSHLLLELCGGQTTKKQTNTFYENCWSCMLSMTPDTHTSLHGILW